MKKTIPFKNNILQKIFIGRWYIHHPKKRVQLDAFEVQDNETYSKRPDDSGRSNHIHGGLQ